jgi:hypothetical protein
MARPGGRSKQAGDRSRRQGSASAELDPDLATTIEEEMRSSGRQAVVPRTAVIGAHPRAVTPDRIDPNDEVQMPRAGGSDDVAPTARALERERSRHARQSALGVAPAGKAGRLRQTRQPDESVVDLRTALDAAASRADREAASGAFDGQLNEDAEARKVDGIDEQLGDIDWIERHPRSAVAGAAAAALMLGLGVAIARTRN